MKRVILIILFLAPSFVFAQSPYTSLRFTLEELMYSGDTCKSVFNVTISKYVPASGERKPSLVKRDTTKYDWSNFRYMKDIDFGKAVCYETSKETYVMDVSVSNQYYIFDNALEINIKRHKCGQWEEMNIVFPVTLSSFVTYINLGTVYFRPGDYWIPEDLKYSAKGKELDISLPDRYWVQ